MIIKKFSQNAIEGLQSYVYILVDPRDNTIFYVGKGTGNRVFNHAHDALTTSDVTDKLDLIREIIKEGKEVEYYIVRHGLSDDDKAYLVESVLIDLLTCDKFPGIARLTNLQAGHGQFDKGIKTVDEIEELYNNGELTEGELNAADSDFIIAINVNRTYKLNNDKHPNLYEATRKSWTLSINRAMRAKYVLSEYKGIVRGIFVPTKWVEMPSDNKMHRWAFEGTQITNASDPVYQKYMNKHLPEKSKGAAMPFRYFGKKENTGHIDLSVMRHSLESVLSNAFQHDNKCLVVSQVDDSIVDMAQRCSKKSVVEAFAQNPNDLGYVYETYRGRPVRSITYEDLLSDKKKAYPNWASKPIRNPKKQYLLLLREIQSCDTDKVMQWKHIISNQEVCGYEIKNVNYCAFYFIYSNYDAPTKQEDIIDLFDVTIEVQK